jgi:hypothetical protein
LIIHQESPFFKISSNTGIVYHFGKDSDTAVAVLTHHALRLEAFVYMFLFVHLKSHLSLCNHGFSLNLSLSLGRLASWNNASSPLLNSFQNCLPAYTIISLFD